MVRQTLAQEQQIKLLRDGPITRQGSFKQPTRPTKTQWTHQPRVQQHALASQLQQPAIGAEISELHGKSPEGSTLLA